MIYLEKLQLLLAQVMALVVNSKIMLCRSKCCFVDNNEDINEETLILKERGFKVISFSGIFKRLTLNNLASTIDEFETIEILVNGFANRII